jgi:uncharacterized tellurite resistance protein B-like protein
MGFAKYLGKDPKLIKIKGDNINLLALVKNPHLHEWSKYIDICHHYTRDLAKQGRIRLIYIPTEDIIADGFIKPLKRVQFQKFLDQLGMIDY